MKTKITLLSILTLILVIGNTFAQKAKIMTSQKEVVTVISAIGEKEIYTESGVIKFKEIEKIIFENFDPKTDAIYSKLSKYFPIEYGDGTNLGGIDSQIFTNPTQIENSTNIEYPEDNLIKGSRSGLLSLGIGVATAVAAVATGGTVPAIAIVGGLGSFSLLVDAWAKIGKAGKMMKAERKKSIQINEPN
jgi:hypothetical protein